MNRLPPMNRIPLLFLFAALGCASPEYDLIIEGGSVVDGTGSPAFVADIGVNADTIAAVGDLSAATAVERVDASGMVVAPGFIDTDMTRSLPDGQREGLLAQIPLGRLGQSAEVAAAVLFLASAGGSYITGETLHVNGGMYMG